MCVSSTYIDDDKVAVYPQRLVSSTDDIFTLASKGPKFAPTYYSLLEKQRFADLYREALPE